MGENSVFFNRCHNLVVDPSWHKTYQPTYGGLGLQVNTHSRFTMLVKLKQKHFFCVLGVSMQFICKALHFMYECKIWIEGIKKHDYWGEDLIIVCSHLIFPCLQLWTKLCSFRLHPHERCRDLLSEDWELSDVGCGEYMCTDFSTCGWRPGNFSVLGHLQRVYFSSAK